MYLTITSENNEAKANELHISPKGAKSATGKLVGPEAVRNDSFHFGSAITLKV